MKARFPALCALLVLLTTVPGFASPEPTAANSAQDLEAKLRYQQGKVTVGDNLATFDLGPQFRYLDPDQSEELLVKGWGNPPGNKTLGMIFPADVSPLSDEGWGVVISFEEDGYVNDKGADKIDYDDLLKDMKQSVVDDNKEREKQGYDPIQLVGWAEPPRYDRPNHKLYWAKELKFGSAPVDTLNYNIRVLGRRGVLVLNAVAGMNQLPVIRTSMQELLPAVEFNPGHRYMDYIPGKDKLAEYGIGALIAGTIAAKAGFFKLLLAGLIAFKKLVLIGLAAVATLFKKLFGKKEHSTTEPIEP